MTWVPGHPLIVRNRLVAAGGWVERQDTAIMNMYRAPQIKRGDASKAKPWRDHLYHIYPDDADHIEKWFAHRVQRPGEKLNHCLMLGGAQGIGKDSLLEPLRHAVGPWNYQDVTPVQMLGRFNGFAKAVVLRINEARDLGEIDRFKFYEHVKLYAVAPPETLRVDEKNVREHYVFNVVGVVITTNYKSDGVFLPADDRRTYVAWSNSTKTDFAPEYWDRLWYFYTNQQGFEHVTAYLWEVDLEGFDPKAPPPKTPAFWDIVGSHTAPEDNELADVLDDMGSPEAVTLEAIIAHALGVGTGKPCDAAEWLRDRRNRRAIPHRMERCGYVPVRNPDRLADGNWKVGGKRMVIYAKVTLDQEAKVAAAKTLAEGNPR
jgi:hypothetical protein